MRPSVVFLIAAFCCAATPVRAAGIQFIDVPIEAENAVLSGAVWYPCAEPAQQVRLHGLSISGTMDCPISGGGFPLVVISHGMTGWVGGHHDTAAALADAGFVVAAINVSRRSRKSCQQGPITTSSRMPDTGHSSRPARRDRPGPIRASVSTLTGLIERPSTRSSMLPS
jgi:predicted dienelactone hydrolase